MRKSWPLAILGIILVLVGLGGATLSIFMAQTAAGNLIASPYGTLALFLVIMLVGCGLFVFFIQKDKMDEEVAKLDMLASLNHFIKIYNREHGYIPSQRTIVEVIEFSLKCQDKKGVTINGDEKAKK